jgi:dolichol-phosphate mannosyltransferase
MKISIVIPARNEAKNIGTTITNLSGYLDKVGINDHEILVVDDGSTDATHAIVAQFHLQDERIRVIQNLSNKHGYGRAVTLGLEHFTGDAVIVYMADASDDPQDVERYYYILRDKADCAFGSRFMKGSKVIDYPRFKLAINRIANLVIRLLFGIRFNDVTNAFKGYRADVIHGCRPFISPHFNLTIEIPLKAIVRGYSYEVMPISWRQRKEGVSSLKLQEQGSRYMFTLLTVWFEMLLTRKDYKRPDSEHFIPWAEKYPEISVQVESLIK